MEAFPGCICGCSSAAECWDNQNCGWCNCECLNTPSEENSSSNSEEE